MENKIKAAAEDPQPEEKINRKGKVPLREVDRYIKYLLFVLVIGLVYIWNTHLAEKQLRNKAKLEKEIAEARADYKTMQAKFSSGTRKSVLAEKVDTIGLKIIKSPPFKLKEKSE